MRKVVFLQCALILTSCSTYKLTSDNAHVAKVNKLKADKRVSYFIYDKLNNRTYTLSEPAPDVILEKVTKIANEISAENEVSSTKLETNQKLELANNAIQLGERTVAVNILRDALFRLSEMNINNRNAKLGEDYKSLFDSVLNVVKDIAIAEKNKTEITKSKAEKEKIEAEIILKELNLSLDVKENYQMAVKFLLDEDEINSINHFKELYKNYPTYFNIDEIYAKLKEVAADGITKEEWKSLYNFIKNGKMWQIDNNLQQQIIMKSK